MAFGLLRGRRWLAPLILVAAAFAAAPLWLSALGSFLVRGQDPMRAGMIVVLAGDYHGNRILKAAELVRQGYAPKVLVSGPNGFYGHHESDLAIAFAAAKGYPADWFIPLPNEATSTREEAKVVMAELRRRGIRKFLVVTSNYHTRRAAYLFRSLTSEEDFRVIAAPDWIFRPADWWRSREGQKQFTFEWMKTIANWVGL